VVENFQWLARTLCSKGIGKTKSPFVVEMRAARRERMAMHAALREKEKKRLRRLPKFSAGGLLVSNEAHEYLSLTFLMKLFFIGCLRRDLMKLF